MQEKINQYTAEINSFQPKNAEELESFRIRFLGTKGIIKDLFEEFKTVSSEDKRVFGKVLNEFKQLAEVKYQTLKEGSETEDNSSKSEQDFTLPGQGFELGARHPLSLVRKEIIEIFNKVKPPYNINEASQALALQALQNVEQVNNWIKETVAEREKLKLELNTLESVLTIYPSDANFILVKTIQPKEIYQFMVNRGIIVRDRSKVELCEGCLRITIGTPHENELLIEAFKNFEELNKI